MHLPLPHPTVCGLINYFFRTGLAMALVGFIPLRAENSSPAADVLLEKALALDEGASAPRNVDEAAKLYAQAAALGDAHAHLRLGYLAETGDGVPQDYVEARKQYESAVAAGLTEARLRLAICHLEGWGGPVNRAAFVREVRAAAEAGNVDAQRMLGSIYFSGIGVTKSTEEAVKWIERAAAQDDLEAQHMLGTVVESRMRKLQSNVDLARSWYELSAEQEYQTSMRALARSYLHGSASLEDQKLGRRWLELASESGDAEAPYILAVQELLRPPSGTPDETKARAWLELASERKNTRATEVLQLTIGGQSLRESVLYVLNNPSEERYARWANRKIDSNALTHPPLVRRAVEPVYPRSLSLSGQSGTVQLAFVVDTTGRVREPKVLSTPHPLFSERALEAIEQWRFQPAKKDGRLVKSRAQVPMQFELKREQLTGVDAVLDAARYRAADNPEIPPADAQELRMAKVVKRPAVPRMADGSALPQESKVLLLLVIDGLGVPVRGYVLEADPKAAGDALLASALQGSYEPRLIEGVPAQSNIVLPYLSRLNRKTN